MSKTGLVFLFGKSIVIRTGTLDVLAGFRGVVVLFVVVDIVSRVCRYCHLRLN
jgi:hypothetical protein